MKSSYLRIGLLRRCLTQQASVRRELYAGLQDVLRNNITLCDAIASLLMPQVLHCSQRKRHYFCL
jgi:hypothetical protein